MQSTLYYTAVLAGLCGVATAQESHYWTMQYGARSTLLGGAVVGGESDNSALYYNPAALAYIRTSALSINTDAYRFAEVYHHDGAGTGLDLVSRRMSLFPQMSSGLLTKKPEKPFRLGFVVLTRYQQQVDISQRHEMHYDVLPSHAGEEYYIGSVDLRANFLDTWIGLGGAYRINEHWSVGGTLFLSYRNHRYNSAVFARMTFNELDVSFLSAYRYQDEVRFNALQIIPKIGIQGKWGNFSCGITLTSPSIKVWGESTVEREISFQNLQGNSDVMFIDKQTHLPSEYQYPFSVATGVSYRFGKAFIGLSGEFFAGIPLYKMIEGEPRHVVIPTSLDKGEIDFLSIWHYARPIVNGGIGYEQTVHRLFKIHTGFRTDFSYRYAPPAWLIDGDLPKTSIQKTLFLLPSIDLFHFSAGASWVRPMSRLTFGLDAGFGIRPNIKQFTNLTSPQANNLLQGQVQGGTSMSYYSLTFLVGYTYFFSLQ